MTDPGVYSITRLVEADDLAEVAALEAASFSNPWSGEMLARELRNADIARIYVLRQEDRRIVGFCACWLVADELHINTLAVTAERRRQGLATRLLRFVFREAAAAGVRRATLEVRRSNQAALRLYQGLGFTVKAVRPRYYSHPEEDGLVLWRDDLPGAARDPQP
jgi:ribosomal-protein-alanine N-acetyltransferase